jgi:hypothetical protein
MSLNMDILHSRIRTGDVWGVKRTFAHEIHHIYTAYNYPDIYEATGDANEIGGAAYEDDLGENIAVAYADNYVDFTKGRS